MKKFVSEISREYGIPVSTINSAVDAALIDIIESESGRVIDDINEKFRSWYDARLQQSRVKGDVGWIEELAKYAASHRMRIRRQRTPDRYSILEPLKMLFSILESCPGELDFAQAASAGEIEKITDCKSMDVLEYVSLFYASIGGNQADQYKVNRLLSRQRQLEAAYLTFYRSHRK